MNISKKIEVLNIVLILISLGLAFILPFELFLFSYAVLGPLHYLTEINWLNKKNFFLKDRKAMAVLLVITIVISLVSIFNLSQQKDIYLKFISHYSRLFTSILILTGFFYSMAMVLIATRKRIISALLVSFGISIFILKFIPYSFIIVGLFLPTIIHVYLFTLFFMWLGAIKNKSIYGIFAIVLMCSVPLIIFFFPGNKIYYCSSNEIEKIFLETRFQYLIIQVNKLFKFSEHIHFSFNSIAIIKIQIFLAFAYTYHYLNWFSKTSIIGWGKNISKKHFTYILFFWILSMIIYYYNYRIGMTALFFFSMFHVIAEFPLNFLSLKEILFHKKS